MKAIAMAKANVSKRLALQIVLMTGLAPVCLAGEPSQMPEHCVALNQPGMWTCPLPPPEVADRGNKEELRSWGIYDLPDRKTNPKGYAAWHRRNFEIKRFIPSLMNSTDPGFDALPGIPIPPTRPAPSTPKRMTFTKSKSSTPIKFVNSFSWAGGVSASHASNPGLIKTIGGSMVVPIDQIPGGGSICSGVQFYWVLHWLGIDGLAGLPDHVPSANGGKQANANLFQAGMSNKLACSGSGATGSEEPYFFIEYWPDQAVTVISSLELSFGDNISFLLTQYPASANQSNAIGYWYLEDDTKGLAAMIEQNLATTTASYPFLPDEAEAITEPPSCNTSPCGTADQFGSDDSKTLPRFLAPDWGEVAFTNLMASTQDTQKSFPLMGAYKSGTATAGDWFEPYQLSFSDPGQDAGLSIIPSATEVDMEYSEP